MGPFSNFLGTRSGRIFGVVPPYVDKDLPPGCSKIPLATFKAWLSRAPTVLWDSLNGLWALVALAMYFAFPYDLGPESTAASAPVSVAFIKERLPLWAGVMIAYISIWHITLYWLNWSKRPFVKDRSYNIEKVAHNMFWTSSALVMWVCCENVFAFLWSTRRLDYEPDAQAFTSLTGVARFIAALMLVPLWRNVHFYFAHRLLHFKALYQHMHALHHRNTDIEPFAGLAMHPVEVLYYFTSVLPSLFLYCSPFALLWNGVHLLMSPTAGHSGWEDHVGSSSFHYMHHR
jgi:lathosterol oxidase